MKKYFKQYKHANSNSRNFNLFKFLFFLLLVVNSNLLCFAQPEINPNGFNIFYYPDGKKSSEGYMKEGKPNGYWKTYYENGNLKSEGNRENFELDSVWKFYTKDGILYNEIAYKGGKKNGISKIYYTDSLGNGRLKEQMPYFNNVKNGEAKYYYPTGELHKIINFKLNKEEGNYFEFAEDGRIITIREYTGGFMRSEEVINRYDDNGEKNGVWKEFYDNLQVKWEGTYRHGQLDGVAKEYTQKGGLKKIEKFVKGTVDEDAAEVAFFELHKEVRPDGSMLVGGYNNDQKQGIFREYDSTGKVVNAYRYKNDVKIAEGMLDSLGLEEGPWKYFYSDGKLKAEGEYINGKKEGEWIYYFPDETIQQKGKYVNGLPNGFWQWWYNNKQLHREETYRKGRIDGESIEYDSIGNVITKGEYIDGIAEGPWFYHVNDHTEEGVFRDGVYHGVWIWKYEDGTIAFKGEYINGLPIGKHKYYYPSGRIKWEGSYDNGEKEGEWIKFKEDGEVLLTIYYKRGVEYKIDGYKIKPENEPK